MYFEQKTLINIGGAIVHFQNSRFYTDGLTYISQIHEILGIYIYIVKTSPVNFEI